MERGELTNSGVLGGQHGEDVPESQLVGRAGNHVPVRDRFSGGVSVDASLDPIRIEVNFTMPLIGRKGERTARGFGIGVGLEFL